MGDDLEACMEALEAAPHSAKTELHIVERINMSFSVQNAILNAPNLTRFKIAGELPELQINFSDRKYSTWILQLVGLADHVRNADEVYRRCDTQVWRRCRGGSAST
jgi:hypothetical protein